MLIAAPSLLVSGIILRASIANSIRPIQGLLPYSPKPSDRLEAFLSSELPSLCPSRIKLSNAYLSVQGGRLELRLRGRAESAAEIALTEFRDSVQLAVDGLAHELPEGQLGVAVELELPEPSEDVQNRRQQVLLEQHHHHHH